MTPIRIGILGAGLLGKERLAAVRALQAKGRPVSVSGVCDPGIADAAAFGAKFNVPLYKDPAALLKDAPEWVVVATPHDAAVDLTIEALRRGHRVLLEKPMGRTLAEAERIAAAEPAPGRLWIGYNYRFFDGIAAAAADLRAGAFGKPISVNMLLGHGHQPGANIGWKLDPVRAGGGCMIDPGVHLLDLCQFLLGPDITAVGGTAWDGFWKTGVEEECHLILAAPGNVTINLQVSIVRWRSTMRIEVNGDEGYGVITGKNRSFGPQSYVRGKRWGWRNAPSQRESEQTVIEAGGADVFADELDAVLFPDPSAPVQPCDAAQGLNSMRILDRCRAVLKLPRELPPAGK